MGETREQRGSRHCLTCYHRISTMFVSVLVQLGPAATINRLLKSNTA